MLNHLELYKGDEIIFSSNGRWIYPLFDLEKFLLNSNHSIDSLFLKDKIAGKAAAHLMCFIGVKKVHIGLLSRLGKEVFDKNNIDLTYDKLVDKIKCRTETLLENISDSKIAYRMLKKRAGLFSGLEIECNNLTCGYGTTEVLKNINISIPEGGATLLLGQNGEGKSTFLRTIANLQPRLAGTVHFSKKREIIPLNRGQIGFLSQNPQTKNMPILVSELMDVTASLLGLKGEEKKYQIDISLRRTGALDFFNKQYYELSGGERQRVNLARLICQRAGIFLLDEPAANLDKDGRFTLIELLKDIHEREMPTIVISSHNEEFINALGWNSLNIINGVIHD